MIGSAPDPLITVAATLAVSYLVGSIPFAYVIVRTANGEDITAHGTGNVGSMNVRRTTGSWWLFALAVVGDGLKGLAPTFIAKLALGGGVGAWGFALRPWGVTLARVDSAWWTNPVFFVPMAAVAGCVLGHNYSLWMAIIKRRFTRTGKGLATGAGALLAYDWRYLVVVLAVALAVIAVTHYMMAGQVAAAFALPVAALMFRSPDWPFAFVMGALVYLAHHKRFVGLLRGREPKLYVDDGAGPRG